MLLAASVPSGVSLILGGGLLGAGRPGLVSLVQGTAAVLTVVGLIVTVPESGAIYAAWTALGARLVAATLATIAFVRVSGIRPLDLRSATWGRPRSHCARAASSPTLARRVPGSVGLRTRR